MKPAIVSALLLPLLLLLPSPILAQREYDIWCFGHAAGMTFSGGSPVAIGSAINSLEAAASIADPVTGHLLFYSDGQTVFNRDGVVMPGGSGLKGNMNSAQGALIVPMPGSRTKYYLFTSDAGAYERPPNEGVHYSIVDMSLDGGRGDVEVKNIPLLATAAEKLTAVRHADRCSYWVLAHGWNDDTFHAYLVSDSGIATHPVVSHTGLVHQDPPNRAAGSGSIGYMKGSPDGRYLAVATFSMKSAELFRFDHATGVVSEPLSLPVEGDTYGVSFSPDNSKVYVSSQPAYLVQFDLSDPEHAAIVASAVTIVRDSDPFVRHPFGALQLGPDGRLYMARVMDRYLGVIENPNAPAPACSYVESGFDLGDGRYAWLGLPNLIDSYFDGGSLVCGAPFADFLPADADICVGDCITFTDRSTNEPTGWQWSFKGGNPSISTERNPSGICFDAPGIYQVTLTVSNAIGSSQATRIVVVRPRGDLRAHLEQEITAAPGDTIAVPVILDNGTIPAGAGTLLFTFRYGPGMMRLLSIDAAGMLLEGWRIDSVADDPIRGLLTAQLVPPPGEGVAGAGTLFALRFETFVGWSDSSSLRFEFASTGVRCLNAVAVPGMVRLEYCGSGRRFIALTNWAYALDEGRPNPFNPAVEIPFSLGLDGHVVLEIFDPAGRQVARLADGVMRAGPHTIRWDASAFPSGVYYCRIRAGGWSSMRELVLRR